MDEGMNVFADCQIQRLSYGIVVLLESKVSNELNEQMNGRMTRINEVSS